MTRKVLTTSLLTVAIAGATGLALAQDVPPAPSSARSAPPAAVSQRMHELRPGMPMHRFDLHDRPARMGHGPAAGALSDLQELERICRQSGRTRELAAIYNDVLSKSQDPMLRTYAYHHLAALQSPPANPDQAIATLRKSLQENLTAEARQREDRDRMRALWEQRAKDKAAARGQ